MFHCLVAVAATPVAVLPSWKHSMLQLVVESRYTES